MLSKSLDQTRNYAQKLLSDIEGGGEHILLLEGDLGAGKTAFVKEIGNILGVKEKVQSPTFILERTYTVPKESLYKERFDSVLHIDAYRLEGKGAECLSLWEKKENPRILIAIEWPTLLGKEIRGKKIKMSFIDEETRDISW